MRQRVRESKKTNKFNKQEKKVNFVKMENGVCEREEGGKLRPTSYSPQKTDGYIKCVVITLPNATPV